jgi:hypothetical protein
MTAERVIEVEFLADDLREIRGVMSHSEQPEQDALSQLLTSGLESFQRDEASWRDVQNRDDSEPFKQELKRRETLALLISMRSRTIRSEIRMNELGSRVRDLERLHADKRQQSELLRRSISRLRTRIAVIEGLLKEGAPLPENKTHPLMARLIRLFTKGNG